MSNVDMTPLLDLLTPRQRDVVVLRCAGLSYGQIAERLGISKVTAWQLYRRAIKRARREYGVSD